jgi:hypothetical protein
VAVVRGWREGACWGARAMLTGLDPHPAPTPLNNSVSISGTRILYIISTVLTGFFYRIFFLQFSHEFSTENIFYRKFLSIFILDSSRFYSTVSVHVPIYGP